jgi:aldose 1-epimerase
MADSNVIRLRSGRLEAQIAPGAGGSVKRLDFFGEDGTRWPVLRGTDKDSLEPEDMGSFPLVPYCNRIRGGSFFFRGREIAMELTKPADPSPLHGHGWRGPWSVDKATESEAELTFDYGPGDWPWEYQSRQRFQLDEGGLTIWIGCRNLSSEAMPCGLGLHPYYPCSAQTRLDTRVGHVWTVDEKVLPVDRIPAEGLYSMRDRLICGQDLDNGYDQWSGEAQIVSEEWPFEIRLKSDNARFFQVYSPTGADFFVAEPVSHANAALNEPEERWSELGLRVLAPGEEAVLHARFEILKR